MNDTTETPRRTVAEAMTNCTTNMKALDEALEYLLDHVEDGPVSMSVEQMQGIVRLMGCARDATMAYREMLQTMLKASEKVPCH
jgi:hypothetical protein